MERKKSYELIKEGRRERVMFMWTKGTKGGEKVERFEREMGRNSAERNGQ